MKKMNELKKIIIILMLLFSLFSASVLAAGESTQYSNDNATVTTSEDTTPSEDITPSADFTANPTTGNAPLTVQFTDLSTGSPTSWSWNFGDGQTSAEKSPSHTFTNAGTYTVVLTASGSGGSSTNNMKITVNPASVPVAADFTANPTSGNAPLTVQFTDKSTGASSRSWNFGDGSATSSDQNPSHTFTTAGTYTVVLTVSDSNGRSSTKQMTITVTQAPYQLLQTSPQIRQLEMHL